MWINRAGEATERMWKSQTQGPVSLEPTTNTYRAVRTNGETDSTLQALIQVQLQDRFALLFPILFPSAIQLPHPLGASWSTVWVSLPTALVTSAGSVHMASGLAWQLNGGVKC